MISKQQVLHWDIVTWSRALSFWEKKGIPLLPKTARGLEIGAWNGGISAYFAQKGFSMICSDIEPIAASTRNFHQEINLDHLIEYQTFSATDIPWPDFSFDFVVFKSVLGALGQSEHLVLQKLAMYEIQRVLKPEGILFFAENMLGSPFHQFARRNFVPWGKNWRYLSLKEMQRLLSIFKQRELKSTGFFAAFISKPDWVNSMVTQVDALLFWLPESWRYVGYGYAVK